MPIVACRKISVKSLLRFLEREQGRERDKWAKLTYLILDIEAIRGEAQDD